jgi:hypothetical protein
MFYSINYPPIITVGHPSTMDPPCAVESPILAAGMPPISTVADPLIILSGGPTHTAISPTMAAGMPPIKTVEQPGPVIGPPTCGIGGVPGVCIGQVCISVSLAAAGISLNLLIYHYYSAFYGGLSGAINFNHGAFSCIFCLCFIFYVHSLNCHILICLN